MVPCIFLSELRERFIDTLGLDKKDFVFPDNAQYAVAIGATLESLNSKPMRWTGLKSKLNNISQKRATKVEHLDPLFESEEAYADFIERHKAHEVAKADLKAHQGNCYLGIDAGSTTTKMALIDEQGRLLFSHYGSNEGSPLQSVIKALKKLYKRNAKGA